MVLPSYGRKRLAGKDPRARPAGHALVPWAPPMAGGAPRHVTGHAGRAAGQLGRPGQPVVADAGELGRDVPQSPRGHLVQSGGRDLARDRLKALFAALAGRLDLIARYGCPHGSLCLELDKRPDAPDLAVHLLARYQGAALLTGTLRDPGLMAREAARAAQWIDALD